MPENEICSAAAQCGADCCDMTPMLLQTFEDNWPLVQVPIVERIPIQSRRPEEGNYVLPVTADSKCVFLDREKLICVIHADRPNVCSDFGVLPELPCPYFDMAGNRRSRADRRRTIRAMNGKSKRRVQELRRSIGRVK